MKQRQYGFTLIEVLLVLALIGIVTMLSASFGIDFIDRNNLSSSGTHIQSALRRAYFLSRSGMSDDSWGVKISRGELILFRGTSYTSRLTQFDEKTSLPGNLPVSGVTEYVFTKHSGAPNPSGQTTLSSPRGTKVITVSSHGKIEST